MATMSGMQRFHGREGAYVSVAQLLHWVRTHPLRSGRIIPVIFWGAAGIGKTQMIQAYCDMHGLELNTYHPAHDTSGAEIVGQAYTDPESKRTSYALPDWLPTEDGPENGVLFIDELNRGNAEVLAGLMEVLGEGTISQSGWKLPKGWQIVCAANPAEVGYDVQELDQAMVNRMVHYAPGWDAPKWTAWATGSGLPDEIVDFALRYQNSYVDIGEEQLPVEMNKKLRCSPRSLEYMASLYERDMPEGLLRVISEGLLGRNSAEALRGMIAEIDANRQQITDFEQDQERPADERQGLYKPMLRRPLTAEEILAAPRHDQLSNTHVYGYDETINGWIASAQGRETVIIEELMLSSVTRMIASLIDQQPKSDDPHHEQRAQLAGRFLARLPGTAKEKAMQEIRRSAPRWFPSINAAQTIWVRNLADQQMYAGVQQNAPQVQAPPQQLPAQAPQLPR